MNDQLALPWYRSKVFVNLLVSVVMQILSVSHVATQVVEADVASIVDLVLQIAAIAFAAYAGYKRQQSTLQPLTLTKAGADKAQFAIPDPDPTVPISTLKDDLT